MWRTARMRNSCTNSPQNSPDELGHGVCDAARNDLLKRAYELCADGLAGLRKAATELHDLGMEERRVLCARPPTIACPAHSLISLLLRIAGTWKRESLGRHS